MKTKRKKMRKMEKDHGNAETDENRFKKRNKAKKMMNYISRVIVYSGH